MADPFETHAKGLDSPADRHFSITADANNDLGIVPRELRCGSSGTVTIRDKGGVDIVYTVTAGERLPIRAVRVTAMTVTQLVGWY